MSDAQAQIEAQKVQALNAIAAQLKQIASELNSIKSYASRISNKVR